jgi:hypothetical protein
MSILNWSTYGMMTDVVASGAAKFTGNHSAPVLYVFYFRTNNHLETFSRRFHLHRSLNLYTVQEAKQFISL